MTNCPMAGQNSNIFMFTESEEGFVSGAFVLQPESTKTHTADSSTQYFTQYEPKRSTKYIFTYSYPRECCKLIIVAGLPAHLVLLLPSHPKDSGFSDLEQRLGIQPKNYGSGTARELTVQAGRTQLPSWSVVIRLIPTETTIVVILSITAQNYNYYLKQQNFYAHLLCMSVSIRDKQKRDACAASLQFNKSGRHYKSLPKSSYETFLVVSFTIPLTAA